MGWAKGNTRGKNDHLTHISLKSRGQRETLLIVREGVDVDERPVG